MEAAPQPEQDNQPAEVPASTERHLQAVPDLPAEESASFDGSQLVEKKSKAWDMAYAEKDAREGALEAEANGQAQLAADLHAVADRQSEIAGARFDKRSEASLRGWETRRNRSGANGQAANLRQAQRDIMPKVKESAPSEPRMSTDPDVLARAEAARENSRELLEQMNHMSTPSQEVNTDTSVEEADEEAPQEPSVEEEQGEEAEAEERAEQSRRGIFSTIRGWGSRLNDRIRQMDIGMRFGGGRGGNGGEGNEGGEDGERNTSNRRKLLVAAVAVVGLGASIYALARWGTDGGIDVDYPRPEGLTDGEYQNRYLPGSTEGQATFWPERLLDKPNRLARFQEQYADYLRRVAGRG